MIFPSSTVLCIILSVTASVRAISILNGEYETTTDVQDYLNLALQAQAMREAEDLTTKKQFYTQGLDSSTNTPSVTLQSLSLNAGAEMSSSPFFNVFRYGFLVLGDAPDGETEGTFDGHPIEQYGDTLVNDLFSLDSRDIETEAAMVTTVWMACVHQLFQVLIECQAQDAAKGMAALDKAVALWVGADQVPGANDQGHLLYELAETAGERFGQDNGVTVVNEQLMQRFNSIQSDFTQQCNGDQQGYRDIRQTVRRMIGLMTVPLVQNFIHHTQRVKILGKSNQFVELYALSIIPRVAACDPDAYDKELHLDVLGDLSPSQVSESIRALQGVYHCLEITCQDVGSYLGGVVPQCQDNSTVTAVGYATDRFGPKGPAALDRDIRAINIFLRFEAYGAAEDWYIHGWNSELTLQMLARNQLVPPLTDGNSYIDTFQEYYQDLNFADSMIINAIQRVSPYNSATNEQVRFIITGILKHVVIFMTSATSLQYAVQQCDANNADALSSWDTGALLYLGSMDGSDVNGGKLPGESLYSTSKELCGEFGTCTTSASSNNGIAVAAVNTKIVDGLSKAISEISSGSCAAAVDVLNNDLLPAMIVPLIQGTIKYASINAGLDAGTSDVTLAIGNTFAQGILPIIKKANAGSALTIQSNMVFQLSTKPVADEFQGVADALRLALQSMGTDCADIGTFEGEPIFGNMCETAAPVPVGPQSSPTRKPTAPTAPTTSVSNLAWGRYAFRSVEAVGDADFALDVRDMWESDVAVDSLYDTGKNVEQGLMNRPDVVSLADLSREMVDAMRLDQMYSIYKYSLYDDEAFDGNTGESFSFADEVVVEALLEGQNNQLAAQAAVVLNVWQIIVHRLYESVRACNDAGADPVPFIDSAVALWIGKEQEEASFDSGWMIYQLVEETSHAFGFGAPEAPLNTELMERFNELQASADACSTETGRRDFYYLVQEQVQVLSKVLILAFLSVIYGGSRNKVELYGVAILPQAVACDEAVGQALASVFIEDFSRDKITNAVLDQLASFLRCHRVTADDLEVGGEIDLNLSDLLVSLKSRLSTVAEMSAFTPIAGYQPRSDVSEVARMDLDALQIKILLATQAYETAMDVFKFGRNAYSQEAYRFLSFDSILNQAKLDKSDIYDIYSEYWDSETFATDVMNDVIGKIGAYESVSRKQRAELGFRVLQGLISYVGIYANLQDGLSSCFEENTEDASFEWDSAVALFVGSGEGLLAGGRETPGGAFLYALSEEICNDFGLCDGDGETVENESILFVLASGRDAIKDGNCEFIRRLVRDEVTPKLTNVIVQGLVAFAIRSQLDTDTSIVEPIVGLHVFAEILIPLVNKVNSGVATKLKGAYGELGSAIASVPMDIVLRSLAPALRGMGIDCKDVDFPQYSLCLDDGSDMDGVIGNVPYQAPLPSTPTVLGDGIYVTTTFVQDRADIAKDVADIADALTSKNFSLAIAIYQDGRYSNIYDANGKLGGLRSLKSLSVEATKEMLDEPLFNMFIYALRNSDDQFMSRDMRLYADSLVEDSFKNNTSADSNMLPVEAMLALNLWMYLAHSLYETLEHCRNKEIRDTDGIQSMDIAVAYWIGDGQVAGSGNNGHLLYAMAERMGEIFNMDINGLSRTNSNILKLFREAKESISLPEACSENPLSYLHIARIANSILSLMAVPLIQNLIHALRLDDRARVKLYAYAFVPLVGGCGSGPFNDMKEKLLTTSYDSREVDAIVDAIRKIYPCLGLSCADIGVHKTEMGDDAKRCRDPDIFASMAGYTPTSDVREFSQLDLDMQQLDILLSMKAYKAAENLYTYGKHVSDTGGISVFNLATTPNRTIVPQFDAFIQYYMKTYEEPDKYADHVIRDALQNSDGQWSDVQRRIIVLRSAEVMVMYFGALQYLYAAVSACEANSVASSSAGAGYGDDWDRGAALLIGSLEGTKKNGTHEGHMFYDLSQEYCQAFGTCSLNDSSVTINEDLISLLYMGRGAALSNSCPSLKKAASEIASLLVIPIIQGALYSATQLSKSTSDSDLWRAEGYVFSRAILPLVARASSGAAATIDEYLGFPGPSNTRRTTSAVFSAFADAYPKMGVDCKRIGHVDGNNPCDGVGDDKGRLVWIIVGSILSACALFLGFVYTRRRQERTKKLLPENNPEFIRPLNGIMNHSGDLHYVDDLNHSMNLLERAFSSNRTTPHSAAAGITLSEDLVYDASADLDFDEIRSLKDSMVSRDADII